MPEFGLPAWNDASAYPAHSARHDWRWEFVRRNASYRTEWERRIRPVYDESDNSIGDGAEFKYFVEHFGLVAPLSPSLPGPMLWQHQGTRGHGAPPVRSCDSQARRVRFTLADYEQAMIFDLARPLDEQWAVIKRKLAGDVAFCIEHGMPTPRTARNHRRMYPLYLRLLDAREQGAKRADVIAELFPGLSRSTDPVDKYKATIAAARDMRDKGFKGIR